MRRAICDTAAICNKPAGVTDQPDSDAEYQKKLDFTDDSCTADGDSIAILTADGPQFINCNAPAVPIHQPNKVEYDL
ncbi:MAG TPA: hypothetical protein VGH74_01200 [Planctomycetaceae bacterium]